MDKSFAIRPGSVPDDPNLIVRRLGENPIGVYCTQAYARSHGMPSTMAEHVARPFACMEGRTLRLISSYFPDTRPGFVVSTLQPLIDAVASGEFAALLPSLHADRVPGFVRCFPLEIDSGSVWLVYHPRLRRTRHAHDFAASIAAAFKAWANAPSQQS